jgi:phthalate 4,5-dioxygenase reductase subunit
MTLSASPELRPLRVVRKACLARDIVLFELRAPDGAALAPFTAGAHVPVRVPSGAMRQYSLCGDPQQQDRYLLAVKREAAGRGGSASLVDGVAEGDTLMVGPPRNLFALSEKARSFILVAGGIGITPLMAMVRSLQAEGLRPFKLYYLTRDAQATAFADELALPEWAGKVRIHHDHGDPAQALDLWTLFEKPASGAHVYCCGPQGLMDAVRDMTGHWPDSAIHFESFGADTRARAEDQPFEVELARSGRSLRVDPGQTLLQALREAQAQVPSSCESGTCGSCKVGLLAGEADHRDQVLLPEERASQVMVCVSRARSARLVLDL